MTIDPKIAALARYLECSPNDIIDGYGDHEYDMGSQTWVVTTDEEADTLAEIRVKDNLWAFNSNFLCHYTSALDTYKARKAFDKMREILCEDAQEFVVALLGNRLEECIKDAITEDGRGHFISQYDGMEIKVDSFYLYRVN